MTAADQPTTEPSAEVPLVYSVDRSWESRMRVDANDDPYDGRKMHRTWPGDDDRYGTAACSRRVILNIEDAMPANDSLIVEGMLCRRCIPAPPPAESSQGSVLREWAQRIVEREVAPAPQPAVDTERPVCFTPRGFGIWSEFTDRYGQKVTVFDSSIATESCVWVAPADKENIHLNETQATELRDALSAWLTALDAPEEEA